MAQNIKFTFQDTTLFEDNAVFEPTLPVHDRNDLALLIDIARTIATASTADVDASLKKALTQIATHFQAETLALYLYQPEQDAFHPKMAFGAGASQILDDRAETLPVSELAAEPASHPQTNVANADTYRGYQRFKPGEGVLGRIVQQAAPAIVQIEAPPAEAGQKSTGQSSHFKPILGAPLLTEGNVIGLIVLWRAAEIKEFIPQDISVFSGLAHQITVALERARLLEQEQRLQQVAQSQQQVAARLSGMVDRKAMLDEILTQLRQIIPYDSAGLFLKQDDYLVLSDGYNLNEQFMNHKIPLDSPLQTIQVFKDQKPRLMTDVRQDPYWDSTFADGRIRSWLAVPLLVGEKAIGVLTADHFERGIYTKQDAGIVQIFANQTAMVIENTRLFEQQHAINQQLQAQIAERRQAEATLQKRNMELALINRASQIFTSTLALDQVLEIILNEMHSLLDIVATSFWHYVPGTGSLVCRHATGPEREQVIGSRLSAGQGIAGEAAQSGKTLIISDTRVDERHYKGVDQKTGLEIRSLLSLPLKSKGEVIGVLNLADTRPGRLTETDLDLLEPIAAVASSAIENARLFEETEIQRTLAEVSTTELGSALETLKATQNQLIHQEKMASLGSLTAGIAHEIKNPLNFVNNFAAMSIELAEELKTRLETQPLPQPEYQAVQELLQDLIFNANQINKEGHRANQIIRSMLLHSRGKTGEYQEVNLNNLVREAINLTHHSMRAKHQDFSIKIRATYDPLLKPVPVVPQDISRVLVNIAGNACYAVYRQKLLLGQNYTPTLWVSTQNLPQHVEIRIRDNGPGMPPGVQKKIFAPFFTTKPPGEGTGLGLSISHEIITTGHRGTLEVQSQENSFTEFIITLPKENASSFNI